MTTIDIDAIRSILTALDGRPLDRRPALAARLAETVPALLAKVDELTAERDAACALSVELLRDKRHLDDLTAALTQSRAQAATYANEIGTLTAENARLRQQRDAQTAVVEAAKAWRDSDDIQMVGVDEIGEELVAAVDALPKTAATR